MTEIDFWTIWRVFEWAYFYMHIFLHMGMIFSDLLDTADYTAKCNTFKVNRKISKWYGVSMARQKRALLWIVVYL